MVSNLPISYIMHFSKIHGYFYFPLELCFLRIIYFMGFDRLVFLKKS